MSQYKDVRRRPWFNKLYNDDQADQEYSLVDAVIDVQHLNTATLDWMMMIEDSGQFDDFLLMEYKQQFEEWPEDVMSSIDQRIRKAMKELFRSRGVYMPVYSRDTITTQFANLIELDRCPLWPEDELALAKLDLNFKCRQMIPPQKPSSRLSTPPPPRTPPPRTPPSRTPPPPRTPPLPTPSSLRPQIPPQLPVAPSAHVAPPQTNARALTDLAKLYTDDQKFSGDRYDVLNLKLTIFYEICGKVGIEPDRYKMAFATMLRGKALTYYYRYISPHNYTFDSII